MPLTAELKTTRGDRARWAAHLCLLCSWAGALAGCGVRGEPLPPLLHVPQPAEIRGVQQGDRVRLAWKTPARTSEGETVLPEKLGPVELYRTVLPGLHAEVSLQQFQAAASLLLELPALREQYSEPVPDGRVGSTAAYAVRLLNRRGESAGFSNIAVVPLLTALPAPAAIHLRVTERAILLEWPPVAGAAGYHLYRATDEGPRELTAQTVEPRHADAQFDYGRDYRYLVRAVSAQGPFRAESPDSPVGFTRPEDLFPPQVPADLTALFEPTAPPLVDLSWKPNLEPDLAGYNLFRSENGGPPRRLNTALLVSPTFQDATVRPGTTYSYAVSAVDRKGNESARSGTVLVRP